MDQAYQQAEETGEHGEVLGGRRVNSGMLRVHTTFGPSLRDPMLRCVLGSHASRRVADQVHDPEDAVAEQQRACEQHG